jgi:hypothetical protein
MSLRIFIMPLCASHHWPTTCTSKSVPK